MRGGTEPSRASFIGHDVEGCGGAVRVESVRLFSGSRRALFAAAFAIAVAAVACVPEASTSTPLITGDPIVGSTLTVSNGGWSDEPTTFAYRWESCTTQSDGCVTVGNDANIYVVASSDLGHYIRATVSGTNSAGTSSAQSASVGPVTVGGGGPEVDCNLRGPGVDLHGCDLSEADLAEEDLTGADLRGTILSGANLAGALLASVDAAGANLYQSDLSGADLHGTDLTDANLEYAELSTADLSGSVARRTSFFQANATGANFVGADLTQADFTGAELTDADQAGATLADTVCPNGSTVSSPAVCG